jgi:allantoinase
LKAHEFLLASRRVVRPEGVGPAAILVRSGRIAEVVAGPPPSHPGIPVVDAGDSVVMPGLVDTHVRVCEPGRSDWEGFATATRAAAAGGVTTLIEMPIGSVPPTTTRAAFFEKGEAAAGRLRVDVGFWGGLVPGNSAELSPLRSAGVFGYEFLVGTADFPEFPAVTEHDLLVATERVGETPLLVDAEVTDRRGAGSGEPPRDGHFRPDLTESEAIARIARLSLESRTPVHVLHVSSAGLVDTIARSRAKGMHVTAETCPHYLCFAAEEIPGGARQFQCAPPIGGREDRERLWQGLADGTLDMVVSGHCPGPPESESLKTPRGISSLGLTLSATWTVARQRGFTLDDLARWMSSAPARLAGLSACKGAIAEGKNADLVVWNPEEEWRIEPSRLHQRQKITPWAGDILLGVVEATYLKGRKIYERGEFLSSPRGEILLSA